MTSPLAALFACLAEENIDVGLDVRERALRLFWLRRLQDESAPFEPSSFETLARGLVAPDVDPAAFLRAFEKWVSGTRVEGAPSSTRAESLAAPASKQSPRQQRSPNRSIARALVRAVVAFDAALERFYQRVVRVAWQLGSRLAQRKVLLLDTLGVALASAGYLLVSRAWPHRAPVAGSGLGTITRPPSNPPPELPQHVWNQRATWLVIAFVAFCLVLLIVAYVVARNRGRGVQQRKSAAPASVPRASPHDEQTLRRLVFRLGLNAQEREARLDLAGTARLTARTGIITLAYSYRRRTPRVWFVIVHALDPWTRDIVRELVGKLTAFGVQADMHPARYDSKAEEDDVALLIVNSARFASKALAEKAIEPWARGMRWALVEARDPVQWGPEIGKVLRCEPCQLTLSGLVQALLQSGKRRDRQPPIRRAVPASGVATLYDALPFAVVASLLEPLDFKALAELLKRFFPQLEPLAVLRFLALRGVIQEPRGVSVTPELRRDLCARWNLYARALPDEDHRAQWYGWRLDTLEQELGGLLQQDLAAPDTNSKLDPQQVIAVREHALLSIECAALPPVSADQVAPLDQRARAAVKRLYGLRQNDDLRPALERRIERRRLSTDYDAILKRFGLETRMIAARLGLVRRPFTSFIPLADERNFVGRRFAAIALVVGTFGVTGWTRLPDPRLPVCGQGRTLCGDLCFDLKVDPAHCGACDKWVEPGMVCRGGQPVRECASPSRMCGTDCVRLDVDAKNCGECEIECAANEECAAGKCRARCTPCGDQCVDLDTNPANCGACGKSCGTGKICRDRKCSSGDGIDCGGHRLTVEALQNDPNNCGACGVICKKTDPELSGSCRSGFCEYCASDYRNCNQSAQDGCEVHVGTLENCSTCGDRCVSGAHERADCLPTVKSFSCAKACEFSFQHCSGNVGCQTNLDSDPANCGGCGLACPACATGKSVCSAGQCTCTCESGEQTLCGSKCVDLRSDVFNCGACGNGCGIPSCGRGADTAPDCKNGKCSIRCQAGMLCGACCVDTGTDPLNCGGCGIACVAGLNQSASCVNGTCARRCSAGFSDCDGDPGCETAGVCGGAPSSPPRLQSPPQPPKTMESLMADCETSCEKQSQKCLDGCHSSDEKKSAGDAAAALCADACQGRLETCKKRCHATAG